MTHVVRAGAEELIWIVVGIFWVIAQIAGSAAKKKKAPPRPATGEAGESAKDPFADLMRKLAGVQEIRIPKPPEPQWVEEPPAPIRKGEIHLAPAPSPNPAPTPARKDGMHPAPTPKPEVAEVSIRPSMSAFRNTLPSMKLPAMKLSFQTSGKSTGNSPILGNIINPADKRTLRRAMLSHIIFSPPKALEEMK